MDEKPLSDIPEEEPAESMPGETTPAESPQADSAQPGDTDQSGDSEQNAEEAPDWLDEMRGYQSTEPGTAGQPPALFTWLQEQMEIDRQEKAAEEEPQEEIPDWVREDAPDLPDRDAADQMPDWLAENLTPERSPGEAPLDSGRTRASSTVPDWVSEGEADDAPVEEVQKPATGPFTELPGVDPANLPEWLQDAIEPEASSTGEGPGGEPTELPDWLQETVEPPQRAVPTDEPPEDIADELPDWLFVEDDDDTAPPAERQDVDVLAAWMRDDEIEQQANEIYPLDEPAVDESPEADLFVPEEGDVSFASEETEEPPSWLAELAQGEVDELESADVEALQASDEFSESAAAMHKIRQELIDSELSEPEGKPGLIRRMTDQFRSTIGRSATADLAGETEAAPEPEPEDGAEHDAAAKAAALAAAAFAAGALAEKERDAGEDAPEKAVEAQDQDEHRTVQAELLEIDSPVDEDLEFAAVAEGDLEDRLPESAAVEEPAPAAPVETGQPDILEDVRQELIDQELAEPAEKPGFFQRMTDRLRAGLSGEPVEDAEPLVDLEDERAVEMDELLAARAEAPQDVIDELVGDEAVADRDAGEDLLAGLAAASLAGDVLEDAILDEQTTADDEFWMDDVRESVDQALAQADQESPEVETIDADQDARADLFKSWEIDDQTWLEAEEETDEPVKPSWEETLFTELEEEEAETLDDLEEMREIALDGYIEPGPEEVTRPAVVPLSVRLRDWNRQITPFQRILLAILLVVNVGLAMFGLYYIYTNSQQIVEQLSPAQPATSMPFPVGVILPGGWSIDLGIGTLQDGQWNPQEPEWLSGTELRRWIAIPWNPQLEAVFASFQSGDPIEVEMSNGDTLIYTVDFAGEVRLSQINLFRENTPSILLILTNVSGDTRWVVLAKPQLDENARR